MANRNTKKFRSVEQEDFIAKKYGGIRSPSSGASIKLKADVETYEELMECKQKGEVGKEPKSVSVNLKIHAELTDEAWRSGKVPVYALRAYAPSHPLSDKDGNLDLIVRHVDDDIEGRK